MLRRRSTSKEGKEIVVQGGCQRNPKRRIVGRLSRIAFNSGEDSTMPPPVPSAAPRTMDKNRRSWTYGRHLSVIAAFSAGSIATSVRYAASVSLRRGNLATRRSSSEVSKCAWTVYFPTFRWTPGRTGSYTSSTHLGVPSFKSWRTTSPKISSVVERTLGAPRFAARRRWTHGV